MRATTTVVWEPSARVNRMRILVYPKDLRSGDSQRSAIELGGALAAIGHSVTVIGVPGMLVERVRELDLELVLLPCGPVKSTLQTVLRLRKVVRERSIDVIHAFEWEAISEAFIAANLSSREVAVVGTIHSRGPSPILPHTVPLLMGARSAAAEKRIAGFARVGVLEPWVDTAENEPGLPAATGNFLQRCHIDTSGLVVALVTSLDSERSITRLMTMIETIGDIAAEGTSVQLLVVGDGALHGSASVRATEFNARSGRDVVVLAGELLDRRVAYAAADVVVASGSSVAHGMAFGKPVVIAGERGFFRPLSHATIEEFTWSGWYGVGSGTRLGKAELLTALEPLLESERLREYRGTYSREVVAAYGLGDAVQRQLQEYVDALNTKVGRFARLVDVGRVGAALLLRRGLRLRSRRRPHQNRLVAPDAENTHPDHTVNARCG